MDRDLVMMLQYVAMNDFPKVKEYAESFCLNNQEDLDPKFLNWLLPGLQNHSVPELNPAVASSAPANHSPLVPEKHDEDMAELLHKVENLVVYESLEEIRYKFNPRRYWVAYREKALKDDIIRMSEQRQTLMKAKIPCVNTTLLFGVPGTGKTMFGRYLAYTLERPFIYVDLCDVMSPHQGGTAKNLKDIFRFVQTIPCVFVMDEIDALGANRNSIGRGGSGDESTKTTLALMQCMDRLEQDVVVLATTNRLDMLDKALLRRFAIHHEFKPFGQDDKFAMLTSYLQDVKETGNLDIFWDEKELMRVCNSNRTDSQSNLISLCNLAIGRAIASDYVVRLSEEASIRQSAR